MRRADYLPQMDHVIYIEDGTIVEQGTYEDLMKNDKAFATFVRKMAEENDADGTLTINKENDSARQKERLPGSSGKQKGKTSGVTNARLTENPQKDGGNFKAS